MKTEDRIKQKIERHNIKKNNEKWEIYEGSGIWDSEMTTDEYIKYLVIKVKKEYPGLTKLETKEIKKRIEQDLFKELTKECENCGSKTQVILERNDNNKGWHAYCLKCKACYGLDLPEYKASLFEISV